ncbi:DegT/DnrJ/EryC1/StrS family aminotransferase [Reichenbachiella ulvae]|uniref:DegT/DnrJ/EryC1/StrS family aminotransferase n=1 Tax=Reichenbachiella ulvae TaxID=2980104 RepID=A0ABT3CVU4_9BACT|nr:DegT/DnrJ/EryC1/StrS family aminotransferase [Reichenbachiella ulvae]MCV9387712.1 DegT/DnrJ/EryC1/StrS family aminotransferase [Reichenbachiella ulvae]
MEVPFFDLTRQHAAIENELFSVMEAVMNSGQFLNGTYLSQFEDSWSQYLGVEHTVGVANGTDAIYLTLKALGIGSGDEVITTAVSWVSTASAIVNAGAKPVFVDVDESGLMNLDLIEHMVSSKTKALLVVHLYGQMVNVVKAKAICDRLGIMLIEDAAQAHGASFDGVSPGQLSSAATYSFYPTKNLGAIGDAGAVVSRDRELATEIRKLANQGGVSKKNIERIGITSRLDELQAAILCAKLKYLFRWNERRVEIARSYNDILKQCAGISFLKNYSASHHVYHQYVILSSNRDEFISYLSENGVGVDVHYSQPLPELPMFHVEGNSFPVAKKITQEVVSLPIFPELRKVEIEHICRVIGHFLDKTRSPTVD